MVKVVLALCNLYTKLLHQLFNLIDEQSWTLLYILVNRNSSYWAQYTDFLLSENDSYLFK